jgi:hypothetical protein
MRITVLVHEEANDAYINKKGQSVSRRMLRCLDASEGPKLSQFIEWAAPDDFPVAVGKAAGQRLTLDVTEVAFWKERLRVRAMVVPVGSK